VRFTGQVRVPEVDHPGVPATFVVEDDQAEVLLDGESLGRWSLFDVHASRLVSAAFSVSLAGDEITFIADEPVDFAYKGVDHMAESWARYKAMTLPRRMIAVGRSRRGTHPSRVAELREAMLANLEVQRVAEWAQEAEDLEAAAAPPVTAPPPPPPPPAPVLPPVEEPVPPLAADEPVPLAIDDDLSPEARANPIRPGPGLVARPPVDVPAPPAPEVDPIDVFRPEPVVSVPAEPEPVETEPIELEPAAIEGPEPIDVIEPIEVFEPEPVEIPEPVAADEPEPEPASAVPELIAELLDTSTDDDREETPKRLVVDLGAYEVPPDPVSAPTQPRVPALATTAPAADKSGIFGAVRAAFVRNKGSHAHEFVEAPGGIGIHRNICSECGYISIGVSESDAE
jgi:hypothetical protein